MTAHVNDQILAQVASLLNGLETTGSRVDEWELRVREVSSPRLVVSVVCARTETGVQGLQQREMIVTVTGYSKSDVAAQVLGTIQFEVEVALAAGGTLGGLLASGLLFVSDERSIEYALERPAGKVDMVFSGLCFTRSSNPSTIA